jgi:6-phosphogluconolactonase (cycloisomerase 2 family)
MRVDPTGQWLLVVDTTPSIWVFGINATTGVLTQQGTQVGLDAGSVSHLYITPNGSFAYVSLGTVGVDILSFNTTTGNVAKIGFLSPKASSNADIGLASDPSSKYLFVTETGINSLRILTINSNGSLTELSTSPVKTGLGPSQVIVSGGGSYVYVTNRTDGTVSGFALAVNGSLTALTGSPYTTGSAPVDLVEDKTSAYIGVACAGGNHDLQVFQIDTTTPGKLDAFATANTGTDPTLVSAIVATQ